MPIIVDNGDGTFQYFEEPRPEGLYPPTPYPNVSPVDELRNETVRRYRLSPEARDSLYNTSTRYENVPSRGMSAGVSGFYRSAPKRALNRVIGRPDEPITIHKLYWPMPEGRPIPVTDPSETLQHEHAHKWMYDNTDEEAMSDFWMNQNQPLVRQAWENYGDEGVRRTMQLRDLIAQPYNTYGHVVNESYANLAETPERMTWEQRDRWYPGMFQEPGVMMDSVGMRPPMRPEMAPSISQWEIDRERTRANNPIPGWDWPTRHYYDQTIPPPIGERKFYSPLYARG